MIFVANQVFSVDSWSPATLSNYHIIFYFAFAFLFWLIVVQISTALFIEMKLRGSVFVLKSVRVGLLMLALEK